MSKVIHLRLLCVVLTALSLTACVERVAEREGATIEIVPVTYSLSVDINKNKVAAAWEELDQFVELNWDKVSTQAVVFTWYTSEGKTLAEQYHKHLLGKGVNRTQLSIQQAINYGQENPFDLQFKTVMNKVVVEVCDYPKVGNFGTYEGGCYADGARWQSMVNPEKMLSSGNK